MFMCSLGAVPPPKKKASTKNSAKIGEVLYYIYLELGII